MSSPVVQIEKLDESNYDSWSIQMRSVLVLGGLWKITNGVSKKENCTGAEIEKWEADDEKALASICLSVKPSQLTYIRNCSTASVAWSNLKEIHQPKGPLQKVSLYHYKKLLNLSMTEDAVDHINEFTETVEKLTKTGIQIQEELLVIMLLSSLPKNFENFVIAMETRDVLPSLTLLKQKIVEEATRRKENDVITEAKEQQAFAVKNTQYKKTRDIEKKGQKHTKGGHPFTMLAAAETNINREIWYFDINATTHMCNNRMLFSKFEQHSERIALAGNKYINATGKGDVSFTTSDRTIKLEDVLYSPELQANFISIDKAVDDGFSVTIQGDKAVLETINGDVILTALRKDNVFETVPYDSS